MADVKISEMMSKINSVLQAYASIIDVDEKAEFKHLLYDLTITATEGN